MGIKICRKTREMGILSASSKLEDYIEINYITYIYIFYTYKKKLWLLLSLLLREIRRYI